MAKHKAFNSIRVRQEPNRIPSAHNPFGLTAFGSKNKGEKSTCYLGRIEHEIQLIVIWII